MKPSNELEMLQLTAIANALNFLTLGYLDANDKDKMAEEFVKTVESIEQAIRELKE